MQKVLQFVFYALAVLGIIAASLLLGYQELERWGQRSHALSDSLEIELHRGTSLTKFSQELREGGVIANDWIFRLWVRFFSDYRKYQAGRYLFSGKISPAQVDETIRSGDIYEPVVLEVAIPEGFTAKQIFERAEQLGVASTATLLEETKNPILRREFPMLPNGSLEGYLFPATYRFTEFPTAQEFVKTLVRTFFERLPLNYEEDLMKRGFTLHEGVIIASLIERETLQDDERVIVSEVIQNRLAKDAALAIDASIIYGIPDFDGNLRRRHLQDATNPYNTRKHKGLPPGPICSPSTTSLTAVVHPTELGYWYYVVDADDFSKHRFSHTLKEHNRNVSAFWKAKKKLEGK